MSRQLASLEEHLGAKLVLRSTRQMRVTEAGQRWYEHSVRILRDIDAARETLSDDDEARGMLVVSASISLGLALIVPRLAALTRANPSLKIDLRLEEHVVDLVADGVDVAVRGGSEPRDTTSLIAHPIEESSRIVVGAPSYIHQFGVPRAPEDLGRHSCLVQLDGAGRVMPWTLAKGRMLRDVAVQGPVRVNAPIALRDLARNGVGLALLPEWLVSDDFVYWFGVNGTARVERYGS